MNRPLPHISVVLGTRPELIKLAPVIREARSRLGVDAVRVIDTGQHYDEAMSGQFWTELGLGLPELRLDAGGLSRGACVGQLLTALGDDFVHHRPDAVIVQGDTNSTLAGGLAANAASVPLVHVEAGLRSYDRRMPEEHNRIVVDHLADLCCAATPANLANLAAEGIPAARARLTGNTVVEAVGRELPPQEDRRALLRAWGLSANGYVVATIHRPENTDDPDSLSAILRGLGDVAALAPVVLPLHPRTEAAVRSAGLTELLEPLRVVEPLGSRKFLALAAEAAVIASDSGGIAEEVTVLKRPLVVVRRSTERAEAIDAGFAKLVAPTEVGTALAALYADRVRVHEGLAVVPSPFGDDSAPRRVVDATLELLGHVPHRDAPWLQVTPSSVA